MARPNGAFPISGPTRFRVVSPQLRRCAATLFCRLTERRHAQAVIEQAEICISARPCPPLARSGKAKSGFRSSRFRSSCSPPPRRPKKSPSARSTSRPASRSTTRRSVAGVGPVDADEILKGYEYQKGNYVLLTDEEIEAVKLETRKDLRPRAVRRRLRDRADLFRQALFRRAAGRAGRGRLPRRARCAEEDREDRARAARRCAARNISPR